MSVCTMFCTYSSVINHSQYPISVGERRRRVTCPSKLARYSQAVIPCLTSFNPNHGGGSKSKTKTKFFSHGGTNSSTRSRSLKPHLTVNKHHFGILQHFHSNSKLKTTQVINSDSKKHSKLFMQSLPFQPITSEDEGNLETLSVLVT